MKTTTKPRTRTSPPKNDPANDAARSQKGRATASMNPPRRTPIRPLPESGERSPLSYADRASHPEDAASDDRLARSLAANAGRTALSRHRERVTAIENEEDGVPEDEDGMEDAAQAEIDADTDDVPGNPR
jgi:hypothetical protein